ncbi:MAG: EAL domain-containing protein, partial [Gammaproteobacteria bacterium]|nr:EAL domain-containing protein [Gammaproteobacteria bacterium]
LSLSPHFQKNDTAAMNSMIDAIFDRGYYSEIHLEDIQGKMIIQRKSPVRVSNVPEWFVNNIVLNSPDQKAIVMSGWKQGGYLYVKSHPGYAYSELWSVAGYLLAWVSILLVVLTILGLFAIRIILKPLLAVEQQARDIAEKRFTIQENLPATRELNSVVSAMNSMAGRLKDLFQDQLQQAVHWKTIANEDPVSRLKNARFFFASLASWLSSEDEFHSGYVFLLHLNQVANLNEEKGEDAGDMLMEKVATILSKNISEYSQTILSRYKGPSFLFAVSGCSRSRAELTASHIVKEVSEYYCGSYSGNDAGCYLALYCLNKGDSQDALIDAIKQTQACQLTLKNNTWEFIIEGNSGDNAHQEWSRRIQSAIDDKALLVYSQKVISNIDNSEVIHRELLMRISGEQGEVYSAGEFMHTKEYRSMSVLLDKVLIKSIISNRLNNNITEAVTINISEMSYLDKEFSEWLSSSLSDSSGHIESICFELSEELILNNRDEEKHFLAVIRNAGCKFGIDHFGSKTSSFKYVNDIMPDYIKLDGAYTMQVNNQDTQFFISTIVSAAHSHGIKVIAEMVSSADQQKVLARTGVDGFQGYYIDSPSQY